MIPGRDPTTMNRLVRMEIMTLYLMELMDPQAEKMKIKMSRAGNKKGYRMQVLADKVCHQKDFNRLKRLCFPYFKVLVLEVECS